MKTVSVNDDSRLVEPGQPGSGNVAGPVSLVLLLDTLVATEPEWTSLPGLVPLFLREPQDGLAKALGVAAE